MPLRERPFRISPTHLLTNFSLHSALKTIMPGVRETVRAAATRLAGRLRGSHASYNAASEQPEQAGPVHEPVPAAPAGDEAAPLDGADVDGFPPLPFLPFHRNALFARGEVVGLPAPVAPWDLPGNVSFSYQRTYTYTNLTPKEHYPRVHGRRVNALWLEQ